LRLLSFLRGLIFLYTDLIYFLEWEVLSLQSISIVITFFI